MIGIRVSDSVNTTLKELASKKGMTVSAFVKWKVEDFVNRVNHSVNTTDKVDSVNTTAALPIYNPAVHKPGTHVRAWKGRKLVEAVVPALDGDGHPMPW